MGQGASKQAGKAAAAAGRRQYPTSPSLVNSTPSTSNAPSYVPKPTATPQPSPVPQSSLATDTKNPHVDLDGRDPHFGSALKRLGPAVPVERAAPTQGAFPTSSQPPLGQQGQNIFPNRNSASNSGLLIVQARERIARQHEGEMEGLGRASFAGRTLISAKDIKEVIRMRDQGGVSLQQIEKQMRLKPGILSQLAKPGLYANV